MRYQTTIRKYIPKPIKQAIRPFYHAAKVAGKSKVFYVGRNKTGTTSMKAAMKEPDVEPMKSRTFAIRWQSSDS